MSHTLYLMRHAQSADKQIGQSDKERELTMEGMRQSLQIGNIFKKIFFYPDIIISSSAIRAQQTARYLAEALQFPPEKIKVEDELYQASVRTFLEQIQSLEDSVTNVLCVGHNPTISYLAEYLTKAEVGDLSTAAVAVIEFSEEWKSCGEGKGHLVNVLNPETLF